MPSVMRVRAFISRDGGYLDRYRWWRSANDTSGAPSNYFVMNSPSETVARPTRLLVSFAGFCAFWSTSFIEWFRRLVFRTSYFKAPLSSCLEYDVDP